MAFDPDPDIYFSGIIFDSAGIIIPNETIGSYDENDSRTVIYSILERLYNVFINTTVEDRPQNMEISKINTPISSSGNTYRQSFSLSFNVSYSGQPSLVNEPS